MNVICLEEEAFYALIEEIIRRIKPKLVQPEKWISTEEAMKRLGITSKTTLQKYRDEGRIRYSQPDKKVILYDTGSIREFLEKHTKHMF